MKRVVAFVVGALIAISASAKTNDTGRRKMLEEGKTWTYYYHKVCQDTSFETGLGPLPCINVWPVEYELKGDTMINDRQYMKMYRYDMNANITEYFGAFREDDEGRVYMYSDYDKKDQKMIDFSLDFDETYITPPDTILTETIKPNGKSFRRYRYIGKSPDGKSMYDLVNGPEENVVKEINRATAMGAKNAQQLFMQMWIFIHGAGCMAVTGDYDLDEATSVYMLESSYKAFCT